MMAAAQREEIEVAQAAIRAGLLAPDLAAPIAGILRNALARDVLDPSVLALAKAINARAARLEQTWNTPRLEAAT